jgi:hypothetical protein
VLNDGGWQRTCIKRAYFKIVVSATRKQGDTMVGIHILLAIAVAAVLTAVLVAVIGFNAYEQGGWATALVLFGVLFLTAWAGGVWLHPIGPQVYGTAWMPFVLMGVVAALLIAAVSPRHPRTRIAAQEQADAAEVMGSTVSAFVWIFGICLIAAITLHYAYHDQRSVAAPEDRGPPARTANSPDALQR